MRFGIVIALFVVACSKEQSGSATNPAPSSSSAATGVMDTSSFDRTCKTKDDCRIVQGVPCTKCGCPATPIAASEAARFAAAQQKIDCATVPKETHVCGECRPFVADCESGRCVAKPAP